MKRFIVKCLFVFLILIFNLLMAQSSAELREARQQLLTYKNEGERVIHKYRRQIRPFLNQAEKLIEQDVEYEVTVSHNAQAVAYLDGDKRYIQINAGLLEVIDWVATTTIINAAGYRECSYAYLLHLFDGIKNNTVAEDVHGPLTKVYSPFGFASINHGKCSGISDSLLLNNPEFQEFRKALIGGSVRWLLSHELGHHIHKHDTKPETFAESRQREMEADSFAFRMMNTDDMEPFFAMPILLIIANLGGTVENEPNASHPAGTKRFRVMLDALDNLMENDANFRAYLRRGGNLKKWNILIDTLKAEMGR